MHRTTCRMRLRHYLSRVHRRIAQTPTVRCSGTLFQKTPASSSSRIALNIGKSPECARLWSQLIIFDTWLRFHLSSRCTCDTGFPTKHCYPVTAPDGNRAQTFPWGSDFRRLPGCSCVFRSCRSDAAALRRPRRVIRELQFKRFA